MHQMQNAMEGRKFSIPQPWSQYRALGSLETPSPQRQQTRKCCNLLLLLRLLLKLLTVKTFMSTLHSRIERLSLFFSPKKVASSRFATEHEIEMLISRLIIFKYMIAW